MKLDEIELGHVFKYADTEGDGIREQVQFLKIRTLGAGFNVVNVANWTPATVDPERDLTILGEFSIRRVNIHERRYI